MSVESKRASRLDGGLGRLWQQMLRLRRLDAYGDCRRRAVSSRALLLQINNPLVHIRVRRVVGMRQHAGSEGGLADVFEVRFAQSIGENREQVLDARA